MTREDIQAEFEKADIMFDYDHDCDGNRIDFIEDKFSKVSDIVEKLVNKNDVLDLVSSSKRFGEKTKFHYISPKTTERHIKEFEFMADAYYWGMQNLDVKLDWQIVEL